MRNATRLKSSSDGDSSSGWLNRSTSTVRSARPSASRMSACAGCGSRERVRVLDRCGAAACGPHVRYGASIGVELMRSDAMAGAHRPDAQARQQQPLCGLAERARGVLGAARCGNDDGRRRVEELVDGEGKGGACGTVAPGIRSQPRECAFRECAPHAFAGDVRKIEQYARGNGVQLEGAVTVAQCADVMIGAQAIVE